LLEGVPGSLFGSTFGGGPLVLAAAAEVARRVASPGFLANVRATSEALCAVARRGPVIGVRGAGLLLGLELEPGLKAAHVRDGLLAQGVLVGTSDDPGILRLSPALTLDARHAERFGQALEALEVRA
jgi:acetylornithine/succinyldiaminopimelate/putrescine aminotransferase